LLKIRLKKNRYYAKIFSTSDKNTITINSSNSDEFFLKLKEYIPYVDNFDVRINPNVKNSVIDKLDIFKR